MYPVSLAAHSAIAKLLASMTGGANLPDDDDDPKAVGGLMKAGIAPTDPAIKGLLGEASGSEQMQAPSQMQGIPQGGPQPTPPFNPNAPTDDAHAHREGLLGGLSHLIGADRMAPEVAALLTPEQRERAMPGLLRSLAGAVFDDEGPQAIQGRRADEMLKRGDDLAVRTRREAREAQRPRILAAMGEMPEERDAREDWLARGVHLAVTAPIPDPDLAEQMRLAVNQTRERMVQPRANKDRTILGDDGNYYTIQQDAMGQEVPNSRVRVPRPSSGIVYKEGVGPDGQPVFYALPSQESSDRAGAPIVPRETGVRVPVPVPAPRQMSARELEQDAVRRELLSLTKRSLRRVRETQGLDAEGKPIPGAEAINISGREGGVVPVPEWVKNNLLRKRYGGDAGARARSMFGNLLSQVAKARSGGAVTDAEFNRLEAFLPTSNDDEATVMQKLEDFLTELMEIMRIYSEDLSSGTPPVSPVSPTTRYNLARPRP